VAVEGWTWGDPRKFLEGERKGGWDIILAADCCYHEAETEGFLATAAFLLRGYSNSSSSSSSSSSSPVLYMSYPDRGMEGLRPRFRRWGLTAKEVEGGGEDEEESEEEEGVRVYVLEVRLARNVKEGKGEREGGKEGGKEGGTG